MVVRSGLSRPELLPETEPLHNSLLEALLGASDVELKQAGVVAQLPSLEQVPYSLTTSRPSPRRPTIIPPNAPRRSGSQDSSKSCSRGKS